jgi:hypothetical protein
MKLPTYSIIIWYAIILHLVWAAMLYYDDSVRGVTAVHELSTHLPYPWTKVTLAGVALLAMAGLYSHGLIAVVLMLPQQGVLFLGAFGAIEAMYTGIFPDGVLRPHAFLIADQMPAVLAAIGHTIAVVDNENMREWKAGRYHLEL